MEYLKERVFDYLSSMMERYDNAKPCYYLKDFIIEPYGVNFSKVLMNEGEEFISQLSMQTKADRFQLRGKDKYSGEGVYFLIDSDFNIIYIGQSQDVSKRVYQHKGINSDKRGKFKHVAILYAEDYKGLSSVHVESVLIRKYKPTLNKTHNGSKEKSLTISEKEKSLTISEKISNIDKSIEYFSETKHHDFVKKLKQKRAYLKRKLKNNERFKD